MELSKTTLKAFNPAVDQPVNDLEQLVHRMVTLHPETWKGVQWVTKRYGVFPGADFLNNEQFEDAHLLANVWDTLYPMAEELNKKDLGMTLEQAIWQIVLNQHNYTGNQLPQAPGAGCVK